MRPMAAVFTNVDEAWLVAESPCEVLHKIDDARGAWVELTLANPDDEKWHGRPVYLRRDAVTAVAPPVDPDVVIGGIVVELEDDDDGED